MMKVFSYILASLIFIGFCVLCWIFITSLYDTDPSVKACLIAAFGAVMLGIISHYQTKKREIDQRHYADKRSGYIGMIDLLFKMLAGDKIGKQPEEKEVLERMLNFKKVLMFWGSSEAIEVWNEYEMASADKTDLLNIFSQMEKVLRAIRKDLGHNDSNLKFGYLAGLMLNAEAKKEVFQKLSKVK